ncbi:DUF4129 domain-containing protein [Mycobacterium sp.]|uniref:DUF4129 domain-containing protein n=1 Tax=Mycobacterium sp. TaxID=1785 RepID=UPI0025F8BED1|nr:DUF4129 domain-containing protein [Mycobacterium sp.]MBW0012893.1 DUF4129 domain-containing protein [Mycobacterium sp.]
MPFVDKPTGRVVALLVLMILVAAALRGYLPAQDRSVHTEPGGGRAALVFIIVALSATVALLVIAVIARLRDPRSPAPTAGELSELLGIGKGRPNWRVLVIGLALILAWMLIVILLARLFVPHTANTGEAAPIPTAPPSGQANGQPPQQHSHNKTQDTLGILVASTIAMLLVIVTGSVIMARRRWRASAPRTIGDDHVESPTPAPASESLVRAAEVGLATIGDLNREPREAIIACYAAMERELANVPEAAPQDFDTPTEVLVRAVQHQALRADNAVQLVNLFEEARFSPHVMNEGHREMAENVLRVVIAELRSSV